MVKKNACIFISGAGSNLNNLISRSRDYTFPINIKLVISNNSRAKGLNYAKKNLIPYKIINTHSWDFEYKLLKGLELLIFFSFPHSQQNLNDIQLASQFLQNDLGEIDSPLHKLKFFWK